MAWIRTLDEDEVEGFMEGVYRFQLKNWSGTVTNITKIHSLNERVFQSFVEFSKVMFSTSALDRQTKEMIEVAVSVANECHY